MLYVTKALLLLFFGIHHSVGVQIGDVSDNLDVKIPAFKHKLAPKTEVEIEKRMQEECESKLQDAKCNLGAHTAVCNKDARLSYDNDAAYKAIIEKWHDCFGVDMNIYIFVMDEILINLNTSDTANYGKNLAEDRMGAWGADFALLDAVSAQDDQIKDILKQWQNFGNDDFKDEAIQAIGEFPWLYMNAIINGLLEIGFDKGNLADLKIKYDGFRVRYEHNKDANKDDPDGKVKTAIEAAVGGAFGGDQIAAVISSGSRWDAWDTHDASYRSAQHAVDQQWTKANAQISICYSHQSNAQHNRTQRDPDSLMQSNTQGPDKVHGQVAGHTWEVGARSTFVPDKCQSIFKNNTYATLTYVHFDEVVGAPKDSEVFLGNSHTKYEGLIYPTAVSTQGHPEVPLAWDIAMVASCSLWKFYYPGEEAVPSDYCRQAYNMCDKKFFGEKPGKCLQPIKNDGWTAADDPSDDEHLNDVDAGKEVPDGDPVPFEGKRKGKDADAPKVKNAGSGDPVTDINMGTENSFERDCTACFGSVQLNHLKVLTAQLEQNADECASYSALQTKLKEWFDNSGEGAAADFKDSITDLVASLSTDVDWFKKEYDTIHNATKGWGAAKGNPSNSNDKPAYKDIKETSGDADAFHKVNIITWAIVLKLQDDADAKECNRITIQNILPDAKSVAALWVRNIVTSNLRAPAASK
jgi:GMP synthase-like glutamine amidotransferase